MDRDATTIAEDGAAQSRSRTSESTGKSRDVLSCEQTWITWVILGCQAGPTAKPSSSSVSVTGDPAAGAYAAASAPKAAVASVPMINASTRTASSSASPTVRAGSRVSTRSQSSDTKTGFSAPPTSSAAGAT